MIRTYEGTVRLQGIGLVEGIKAKNIRIGDELVWNFGGVSVVKEITFSKTGKTLVIVEEFNGELYERKMTAERIVAVKELNPAEEVKEIEEAAVIEEVVEAEEMKADFEEAKKWVNYVRRYKDMKYYVEAQGCYSRYRKAGGTQIIEHLEHPERYKELLEEDVEEEISVLKVIKYIKESNQEMRGGILCLNDGTFEAFTMTKAINYKSLKGAESFMKKKGYVLLI